MIDIGLFGFARVHDTDRQVALTEFQGVKPRQVLQILALSQGHALSKDRLADLLWQGKPPASWVSTLEGYVSLLRHALQPGISARHSVLITSSGGYRLDPARVRVDVLHFDELVCRVEGASEVDALELFASAFRLVRGEVLENERPAPWILEARDRYRQRVRRAATVAGRLALSCGDPSAAAKYGQLACDLDPLAEDAWQIVIEAYWRAERRSEALRSFSSLRTLLDRELGVMPGRALQRLYTAVLRDEPWPQVA